jgi:hypothetical protein
MPRRRKQDEDTDLDPYLLLLAELTVRAQKQRGLRDADWVALDQLIELSKALSSHAETAIRDEWDISAADRKLIVRTADGPAVKVRLTRRGRRLSRLF